MLAQGYWPGQQWNQQPGSNWGPYRNGAYQRKPYEGTIWRSGEYSFNIKVIYTEVEQVGVHYSCLHVWCSLLRAAKAA